MALGLIGEKVGMTQIFNEAGEVIPVTVVKAGPCTVVDIKTPERDNYTALKLGYGFIKEKKLKKPQKGYFVKQGVEPKKILKEFRLGDVSEYKVGDELNVSIFSVGEKIKVTGISKGRGFQGVVKRHGFGGGPKTHGSQNHRKPGSIGQSSDPSRVFKGLKMAGHMGNETVTVKNLEVVKVDEGRGVLLIKGAIPGPNGGIVYLYKLQEGRKK